MRGFMPAASCAGCESGSFDGTRMWTFQQAMIEPFIRELKSAYQQTYSMMEPQSGNLIEWTGRLALENIASLYAHVHRKVFALATRFLPTSGRSRKRVSSKIRYTSARV